MALITDCQRFGETNELIARPPDQQLSPLFREVFDEIEKARVDLPTAPHAATPRRRRGRPKKTEPNQQRRELVERWKQAKDAGVKGKDFCDGEGISVDRLRKAVEAESKWRKRHS